MSSRLKRRIKRMQRQLVMLVEEKGSFSNEEVIRLSQRLDRYIFVAQGYQLFRRNGYSPYTEFYEHSNNLP
ncbi:aspartyl-phosphate phosphatase Spo0E family protein [Paenibacillus ehimensis]|uniref:Aspartyl-phosphate phosphatase Spo0E family protein n=2 Tax=Paenibacillus ehimensis TaxID=79264 RepID=A0ABT8V3M7_9BACL|nr:aspartyl-phosphate phosphatase Spo0E family protein [Paenibacillus ehimensis]MDO3676029.1 aspartyl-phosphate phosphatase Spo0E family protein [Paenibacillus ehimensis]MEC0213347.1 aspartyl-phosphate phosphatase Spo0E family protein [Paenibacillus ehimensis]